MLVQGRNQAVQHLHNQALLESLAWHTVQTCPYCRRLPNLPFLRQPLLNFIRRMSWWQV